MADDIQNRKDIRKLVSAFYEKLLTDEAFKHIFLEVAQIDVLTHLDQIVDFWESALFQAGKYKEDLVDIHLDLNQKYQYGLTEAHFKNWLALFHSTVDELFEGDNAKGVKSRAMSIATVIKLKIDNLEQKRLEFNN
ncbi:MAG: group III truncated hemoglobin [Bacteroidota bacterium]